MQHAARALVQPLHVRPTDMGEPQLPAGVRNGDLAGVEMTREHEIEDAGLELVDHLREVAEQDPQIRIRIGEPLRPRLPDPV